MSASELRVDDLEIELRGRAVLHGVGLTARAGEALAVCGPSGAGKTVLLLALAGLLPAIRGTVFVDNEPIADARSRGVVGVILQTQGLVAGLTAEENVALPLQQRGLKRAEVAARTNEALTAVGLAGVGDRLAGQLSGGQRQRVGVARALAGSPEIVIADEPTAELDPDNRLRVLSLLLAPPPRVVVIASNDPEVANSCRRVLHLHDGRIDSHR